MDNGGQKPPVSTGMNRRLVGYCLLLLKVRITAMARTQGFPLVFLSAFFICVSQGAGGAIFEIQNNCGFTVWAAGSSGGGKRLDSGQSWRVQVANGTTGGRFWGRTGCSFNGNGRRSCNTGDCGGLLNCQGSGNPPATMVEYSLNQYQNSDFYDISVIDGFNLPISIIPSKSFSAAAMPPPCKAWNLFEQNQVLDIVDPLLEGQYPREQVLRVITVALLCTQGSWTQRPAMSEIVSMLTNNSERIVEPTRPAFINTAADRRPNFTSVRESETQAAAPTPTSHGSISVSLLPR